MAPSDQADFDEEVKGVYRVQVDQVRVQMVRLERRNNGPLHERKKLLAEVVSDEERGNQVEAGMNDALAQFLQMFQEAHARQFCSFRHCGPGPIDDVSLHDAWLPAPARA